MVETVLGECQCRPQAFIVHDPVEAQAFDAFDRASNDNQLERDLLFRATPDAARYSAEHASLVCTITAQGGRALYLHELIGDKPSFELTRTNPNQVFTRDSLITLPWRPEIFFRARLRPKQRLNEANIMKIAAERLGLREAMRIPPNVFLEGGDIIPFAYKGRRALLVGWGTRSTHEAIDFLQKEFLPHYADEVIALNLAPWRMNLDGGFVPVADDAIVADVSSILGAELVEPHARATIDLWDMLGQLGIRVIDTTPEESVYAQSCNCLCLGNRTIICYDLCQRVLGLLDQSGIRVHRVPGAELIKGRGGPRCMTRPIYLPLPQWVGPSGAESKIGRARDESLPDDCS